MVLEGTWNGSPCGRHGNGSWSTLVRPKFFEIGAASVSHGSAYRLTAIDCIINTYILNARSADGGVFWCGN